MLSPAWERYRVTTIGLAAPKELQKEGAHMASFYTGAGAVVAILMTELAAGRKATDILRVLHDELMTIALGQLFNDTPGNKS